MSHSLPPLRLLLEDVDTTDIDRNPAVRPHNGYSDLSRILNSSPDAEYLEKRFSISQGKRPCISNEFEWRPRLSLPLPPELHNSILEMFWEHEYMKCMDPEAIQACALTCKFWHVVARRHIFRVIVLRSWTQLQQFVSLVVGDGNIVGWVRRVRLCGSLPPIDKSSAGQVITSDWRMRDRWVYYFPYALAPLRDQSSTSALPFNIKILELFDFGHVTGIVEDCEWFAFWLRHLPWLENVEDLYVHSCELASNGLGAIASCFPRLRKVGLANVDVTGHNHVIMLGYSESPPTETDEERLENIRLDCEVLGLDFEVIARKFIRTNGVIYWVPYRWPRIEEVYVNHAHSEYTMLDIMTLNSWMHPPYLEKCLRRLELSPNIDIDGVAYFLNTLGPSPVLEHLRMWVHCDVAYLKKLDISFSRFTNLKSIALRGDKAEKFQIDGFIYILSSLKAPELQRIAVILPYDSEESHYNLIDDFIEEKFQSIEEVHVEYLIYDWAEDDMARQVMEEMFPKAGRRGILMVRHHPEPFRYHLIPKNRPPTPES